MHKIIALRKGSALAMVLVILAALSVLAAAFMLVAVSEHAQARGTLARIEAQALAESGIEHAKAILWRDSLAADPRADSYADEWRTSFDGTARHREPDVDVDGVASNGPGGTAADAVWLPVHDTRGTLVGRYAVLVEDECGKINVNAVPTVAVRHTRNGTQRQVMSLADAWRIATPDSPMHAPNLALFRSFSTMSSRDGSSRWNDREQIWVPRQNLNASPARDILRTLNTANRQFAFEGDQRQMRRLAAAIADSGDDNHALSTASGEYGIESVNFNEVLANEGSRIRQTYYVQDYRSDDIRVHNLAYLYSDYDYRSRGDLQDANPANRERSHTTTAWPILFDSIERVEGGLRLQLGAAPWGNSNGYYNSVRDFKHLLDERQSPYIKGAAIVWPADIWANGFLCVFALNGGLLKSMPEKAFKIRKSTGRELYLDGNGLDPGDYARFTSTYCAAQLRSWIFDKACYAEHPGVSGWFVFSGLEPEKYYRVFLQETNLETPDSDAAGGYRLSEYLDVDGSFTTANEQKINRLRYRYRDGQAVRADGLGCLDVFVTSAAACSPKSRNRINAAYLARPDIIELMNIGDRPISLRGWSLIANTGSMVYELGIVRGAARFSPEDASRRVERNPVIMPRSYFYLCNNEEVFDGDFGTAKDGVWGGSVNEQMPLFELGDDSWGVQFRIKSIRETGGSGGVQAWTRITCENETWTPHQFAQEVVEFQCDRRSAPGMSTSPDGVRALVYDNTRDTLLFESLLLRKYSDVREGDRVMIVGLPRVGGFISMTLKNEYGQIAARLIEYGNPGNEANREPYQWLNWSTEKPDPTRERWMPAPTPSFGGTARQARNRTASALAYPEPVIRNRAFTSVADIAHARRLAAGQDTANGCGTAADTRLVQAAAEYFDVGGVRLDAEEPGAHIVGWLPAFGTNTGCGTSGITDYAAQWSSSMWSNQSVRILSGACRGETFAVADNSGNALVVDGRSIPNRTAFNVQPGDRYTLGPGSASAMYYSRTDLEPGEWEWKNRRIPPDTYRLYLAGLNDSIRTTEFLEENHNPPLDVYLFNFVSNAYEAVGMARRYGKNDRVLAGETRPCHFSSTGGIRLKLVPHGLHNQHSRGAAWFDHAYLSSAPMEGRVNVNTATPRVLAALPGVDGRLAGNIARSIDRSGMPRLKPYTSIGDLLDVPGMTLDLFAALANTITVRSDQFSVQVVAQRVTDANHDGIFNAKDGDRVDAVVRMRSLIDRSTARLGQPIKTFREE